MSEKQFIPKQKYRDALTALLDALDRQYMTVDGREWSYSLRVTSAMAEAKSLLPVPPLDPPAAEDVMTSEDES